MASTLVAYQSIYDVDKKPGKTVVSLNPFGPENRERLHVSHPTRALGHTGRLMAAYELELDAEYLRSIFVNLGYGALITWEADTR
jgi:hypothetical protein